MNIGKILSILLDLELVSDTGRREIRYMPAKCLEGLSLRVIIEKLRTYGATDQRQEKDDVLSHLVGEIQDQYDKALKEAFADASIRDLLSQLGPEEN